MLQVISSDLKRSTFPLPQPLLPNPHPTPFMASDRHCAYSRAPTMLLLRGGSKSLLLCLLPPGGSCRPYSYACATTSNLLLMTHSVPKAQMVQLLSLAFYNPAAGLCPAQVASLSMSSCPDVAAQTISFQRLHLLRESSSFDGSRLRPILQMRL